MRLGSKRGKILLMGSWIAAATSLCNSAAMASTVLHAHRQAVSQNHAHNNPPLSGLHGASVHIKSHDANLHNDRSERHESSYHRYARGRHDGRYHVAGISCVPFAREESGLQISGNAAEWWRHAAGVYARGNQPESGSVLNFRATARMHLGHVAVVDHIVDSRHILVDHANWASHGMIDRGVRIEDVSDANDWSNVRVEMGHSGGYGSVYPTYGFIYAHNDGGGTVMARADQAHPNQIQPHVMQVMAQADTSVDMAGQAESDAHFVPMHGLLARAARHHLHDADHDQAHDQLQASNQVQDQSSGQSDDAVARDLHIVSMRLAQHNATADDATAKIGGAEEVAEAPMKPALQPIELRIYRDYK